MHYDPLRPFDGGAPPDGDFARYVESLVDASRRRYEAAVAPPSNPQGGSSASEPEAPAVRSPQTVPSMGSAPDIDRLMRGAGAWLAGRNLLSVLLIGAGLLLLLLGAILEIEPFASALPAALVLLFLGVRLRDRGANTHSKRP